MVLLAESVGSDDMVGAMSDRINRESRLRIGDGRSIIVAGGFIGAKVDHIL